MTLCLFKVKKEASFKKIFLREGVGKDPLSY